MLDCYHLAAWDNFKLLERESNHWLLEIKESYLLKEIDLRLIRIFTDCRLLDCNSYKQFNSSADVYLVMEAVDDTLN